MFVDREWLNEQFEKGRSLEDIGRELGRDGSTVGYWARKHGLRSPGANRFSARGAPDRAKLERLVAEDRTLREIAAELERSISTVRHWLRRWGIERSDGRTNRIDPAAAEVELELDCRHHGHVTFRLENRGSYRCKLCRQERVTAWRRRLKRKLVAEAGGSCALCGYSRCQAALQFHHLDPSKKLFALSHEGATRGLERTRVEAAKCMLLCANCHAEVEAGYADPSVSLR